MPRAAELKTLRELVSGEVVTDGSNNIYLGSDAAAANESSTMRLGSGQKQKPSLPALSKQLDEVWSRLDTLERERR